VVETHPGLRITGPAGVRNDQRRRQSPDEFVTVRHNRTFERMLRTLQRQADIAQLARAPPDDIDAARPKPAATTLR
jgi:hypothetical protein